MHFGAIIGGAALALLDHSLAPHRGTVADEDLHLLALGINEQRAARASLLVDEPKIQLRAGAREEIGVVRREGSPSARGPRVVLEAPGAGDEGLAMLLLKEVR